MTSPGKMSESTANEYFQRKYRIVAPLAAIRLARHDRGPKYELRDAGNGMFRAFYTARDVDTYATSIGLIPARPHSSGLGSEVGFRLKWDSFPKNSGSWRAAMQIPRTSARVLIRTLESTRLYSYFIDQIFPSQVPNPTATRPVALSNIGNRASAENRHGKFTVSNTRGYCYLLLCDALARLKVGFTAENDFKRPRGQATGQAADVRLVAFMEAPQGAETIIQRAWHQWLIADKEEWFHLTTTTQMSAEAMFGLTTEAFQAQNLFPPRVKTRLPASPAELLEASQSVGTQGLRFRLHAAVKAALHTTKTGCIQTAKSA